MWKKRESSSRRKKFRVITFFNKKNRFAGVVFACARCWPLVTSERSDPPTTTLPDVARGVPLIAVMAVYPDSHDLYGLEEVRILHMGGRSAVVFR